MTDTQPCPCRCHLGGAHVTCTHGPVQPGGQRSCTADPVLAHGTTAPAAGDLDRLCPGPCNRDWHRLTADEQADPDQPVRPSLGQPYWCPACQRRIITAVAELADVYVLLELDKARATKDQGDKVGGSRDAPSPSAADDQQEALTAELVHLEDVIRYARRLRPRRTNFPTHALWVVRPLPPGMHGPLERVRPPADAEAVTVIRAINLIGRHATWWLSQGEVITDQLHGRSWSGPMAHYFGMVLLAHRNHLRNVTKSATGRIHYDRPCPRCDVRALFQEPGDDIVCDACGTVLRHDEYERGGAFAAAADRARDAAPFLGFGVDVGPEDGYSRGTGVPVLDSPRVRIDSERIGA